jgi:hypothetical protein
LSTAPSRQVSHETTFIVFIGERTQQLSTEKAEKIPLRF